MSKPLNAVEKEKFVTIETMRNRWFPTAERAVSELLCNVNKSKRKIKCSLPQGGQQKRVTPWEDLTKHHNSYAVSLFCNFLALQVRILGTLSRRISHLRGRYLTG